MAQLALLFGAGFFAGVMNAVAGGGSFIGFPALILAGLTPVAANASSTVALFPGALTSIWALRLDLVRVGDVPLGAMLAVSMLGGLLGAVLLLVTPDSAFHAIVPWLLLLAAMAFAFARPLGAALRRSVRIGPAALLGAQFVLSVYGGYFGGAVGIMMMAVWGLLSTADLKAMNPAKVLLVGATNAIAVLCFIAAGKVWWRETLAMLFAAAVGGYVGARLTRRLPPRLLRVTILSVTFSMTAAFFIASFRP